VATSGAMSCCLAELPQRSQEREFAHDSPPCNLRAPDQTLSDVLRLPCCTNSSLYRTPVSDILAFSVKRAFRVLFEEGDDVDCVKFASSFRSERHAAICLSMSCVLSGQWSSQHGARSAHVAKSHAAQRVVSGKASRLQSFISHFLLL
jgi:hypothetical protein